MRNRNLHLELIETIAAALGELNKKVAFVGGAVVGLYTNDLAAEDVRPTQDIDITLHIVSLGNLELFREALLSKGFIRPSERLFCKFIYILNSEIIDQTYDDSCGLVESSVLKNNWYSYQNTNSSLVIRPIFYMRRLF